jgi:hypothetical protein
LLDLKHFFFAFLSKKSIISSEKREKPSRYINCSAETKSKKLFQPNGAALLWRSARLLSAPYRRKDKRNK